MNRNLKSVLRTYRRQGIKHMVDGDDVTHLSIMNDGACPILQQVSTSEESVVIYSVSPHTVEEERPDKDERRPPLRIIPHRR